MQTHTHKRMQNCSKVQNLQWSIQFRQLSMYINTHASLLFSYIQGVDLPNKLQPLTAIGTSGDNFKTSLHLEYNLFRIEITSAPFSQIGFQPQLVFLGDTE